jgi:hypothetical protein
MAVPRPLLLALIGVVLLSATFMATRNARDRASDDSSAPAAQQEAVAPAPKQAAEPAEKAPAEKAVQRTSDERVRPAKRRTSKPAAVARAIARKRVVVLAFFQPGADDRETAKSVAAVRRSKKAAVFTDKIDNVGLYGPIVGAVGVSQAPAVVIVDRNRKAHLVEGYVDAESLAQEVSDVRR